MIDVPRVPGAGGQSPSESGQKVQSDAEKFKQHMAVGKTDPEEQKKKKQQMESEEELRADETLSRGTTGKERDTAELERFQKQPKIQKVGESEKEQPKEQKRAQEAEEEAAAIQAISAAPKQEKVAVFKVEKKAAEKEEKTTTAPQEFDVALPEIDEEEIEEIQEKFDEEMSKALIPEETLKAASKETATLAAPPAPAPHMAAVPLFLAPAATTAGYSQLKPELLEIFERLAGVISVMQENGVTETTIHLNSPEFSSSIFAGAKIVIQEFSTAPKAFNIEFQGNSQNVMVFEQNVRSFMQAFDNGRYKFKINRMEGVLSESERPIFHRKGKVNDEENQGEET